MFGVVGLRVVVVTQGLSKLSLSRVYFLWYVVVRLVAKYASNDVFICLVEAHQFVQGVQLGKWLPMKVQI